MSGGSKRTPTVNGKVKQMKAAVCFALLAFATLNTGSARALDSARSDAQVETQAKAFKIILSYVSSRVSEVQKPFYLYHWRKDPHLVQSADAQINPEKYGRAIVEREAPSFIPGLYAHERNSSSVYGGGLYAALDAVSTERFGGMNPASWALLVMHIPQGFKLLELLAPDGLLSRPQRDLVQKAFESFGCSSGKNYSSVLNNIFQRDEIHLECADLIKRVIGTLQIDGFSYSYTNAAFKTCATNIDRGAAVVFTSKSWLNMQGATARLYTARTQTDLEERRAIESQFFYAETYSAIPNRMQSIDWILASRVMSKKFPKEFATMASVNSDYTCYNDQVCKFFITMLYSDGIVETEINEWDIRPFYFKDFPVKFSAAAGAPIETLHWADLAESPTLGHMEDWLHQNLMDCGSSFKSSGDSRHGN